MKLMDIINELIQTNHAIDMASYRFLDKDILDVVVTEGSNQNIKKIGIVTLPRNIIKEIKSKMIYIEDKSLNLDKSLTFAVLLYRFNMREIWNYINFDKNIYSKDVLKKIKSGIYRLYLQDPDTNSTGNCIITIIHNNIVITNYLSMHHKENLVVGRIKREYPKDIVVFVEDPQNIEYYDDDVVTNNF
jgi:hypothetical protein